MGEANINELLQVLQLKDTFHVLMQRAARYIASGETDHPVNASNRIDDERVKGDHVRMFRHAHDAICLVPPIGNVALGEVVLEHHLPRLARLRRVSCQVDLKSEPVMFGEVAAAYCGDASGEVSTWRVEGDPRAVIDEIRGAG